MNERERTVQQLDPLGALAARPLTLLACVGMVVYSVVMTARSAAEIDHPALGVIGIGLVAAIAVLVAVASDPLRAPLSRSVHFAAIGLAIVALAFSSASMWLSNDYIRDDWGPIVVGLVSVALTPYRPPREIAAVGTLAAIFVGFVALLQVESLQTELPAMIYVIIATTPVLAMAYGGAAFASSVLRMLGRWQSRASSAVRALAVERKAGLTRSVQQDRVTILNRDVVPFFADVLERADLHDTDRARAAEISESIRRLMVAEVDRSWLDLVVEQASGASGTGAESVQDPDRLAAAMSTDQRTALRAAIVAIFDHQEFDAHGFDVRISSTREGCAATIRADFAAGEWGVRTDLAPYLAVLRVVFTQFHAEFSPPTLTLRFSYDKH